MDPNLTLEQHEQKPLDKPDFGSGLSDTVHRLYKHKPVGQFNAGDLRIMIGRHMFLEELVPLALDVLESNPWVEGTYFEGDLLGIVIELSTEFWKKSPDLKDKLLVVVEKALEDEMELSYINTLQHLREELRSKK